MSDGYQAPERYLLPEACGVWIPGRLAALIYGRTDLGQLRVSVRGRDSEVDAVLMAMHIAALKWRGSVDGSDQRKPAETETPSKWMTTADVATAIRLSERRVRQEIAAGRLHAERHNRTWRISREDYEHYRAARAA